MPSRPPHEPRGEPRRRRTAPPGDRDRSVGEEGHFSSDQARYFGADTRSFASPPAHRAHPGPPAWRRNRFEAGASPEPPPPYDEEDALTRGYYSLDGPHGGQEFGIEPHGYREALVRRGARPSLRERSEAELAPYGDLALDPTDVGVREFGPPADYAYHPSAVAEFEQEYLDWRAEQLLGHDRDYAAWRADQQRRYDAEYLAFRGERQDRFEPNFAEWRARRAEPPDDAR